MKFSIVLLCIFNCFFASRCSPKFSIKYNDIDSVVRIVNPDHNCNCDFGDKAVSLYKSNNGKRNLYYWQSVYLQKVDEIDFVSQARKTRDELVKLSPELANYKRFYIEFRLNKTTTSDTAFRWENVGVAYFVNNGCEGYRPSITAKELIKKSHNKKFETTLCKKS